MSDKLLAGCRTHQVDSPQGNAASGPAIAVAVDRLLALIAAALRACSIAARGVVFHPRRARGDACRRTGRRAVFACSAMLPHPIPVVARFHAAAAFEHPLRSGMRSHCRENRARITVHDGR